MKIDKKSVDRLLKHLINQRALLARLNGESHAKDLVQAEIKGIELSLLILGIEGNK